MNAYNLQIEKELDVWQKDILKSANIAERASKGLQNKMRGLVPQKIQSAITTAIEKFVKAVLYGANLFSVKDDTDGMSLAERDYLVDPQFRGSGRTAAAEGALTGAGGILVGLADLPALLAIQLAALANAAALYGFPPETPEERLFMLYVFQLAYSGREHRQKCFEKIAEWGDGSASQDVNWEALQIEYRDYLDVAKLLQLVPVIGAPVGAIANHKLMNRLQINTMNAYRLRILQEESRSRTALV